MTEAMKVVALFGATALGKTDVALVLAEALSADIVVADSMQVYAGLAIVTNQPDAAQRARARHHLVGFVPPQRDYSVAQYARQAHVVLDGLQARGRGAIVEGGSGLYLRAALGDLEFGPTLGPAVRRSLEERWADDPSELVAALKEIDPRAAAIVDLRNQRRVIRAMEAALAANGGASVAVRDRLWRRGERYEHRLVALVPADDRRELAARIDARVESMLAAGALEEVAAARAAGPLSATAAQAIGVRELCAVLDGSVRLDEAAARMKSRTRALVRRQLTWLRKLPAAGQVPASGRSPEAVAEEICHLLRGRAW